MGQRLKTLGGNVNWAGIFEGIPKIIQTGAEATARGYEQFGQGIGQGLSALGSGIRHNKEFSQEMGMQQQGMDLRQQEVDQRQRAYEREDAASQLAGLMALKQANAQELTTAYTSLDSARTAGMPEDNPDVMGLKDKIKALEGKNVTFGQAMQANVVNRQARPTTSRSGKPKAAT